MKKLKKYIAAVSLLAMSLLPALRASACGPDNSTPYDTRPFKLVKDAPASDYDPDWNGPEKSQDETCDFWNSYTNGEISRDDVKEYFHEVNFDSFPYERAYPLIALLDRKGDSTAIQYIRDCMEFNKLSTAYQLESWDYERRDPTALRDFEARISKRRGGSAFDPRYALLRMRIAGVLHDDEQILKIWESRGKTMEPSALRDRMGGFVGGVYYRRKDYRTALDYFYAAGDNNSILWCIDAISGPENLHQLYDHTPNSIATLYVLEDYVDYLIGATYAGRRNNFNSPYFYDDRYGERDDIFGAVAQRDDFIRLCDSVVADGRCENPMAWASAKGVLQCLADDAESGLQTLREARGMKGDETALTNLDRMELWALLLLSGKGDRKFDNEFINAFSRFYAEAKAESLRKSRNYGSSVNRPVIDMPTYDYLTRFFAEEAIAHFTALSQPARALAVMAALDDLPISPGYNNEFMQRMRNNIFSGLTEPEALSFISLAEGKDCDGLLDAYFHPYAAKYINTAYDAFGTRLLRASRFEEALEYLGRIDDKWFVTQAIYPYLNRYWGYSPAYFAQYYSFSRHRNGEGIWTPYRPSNVKADFCADMIAAMSEYERLSGDAKAKKAFEIAALYHYASPLGDCWAISDYGWSSAKPCNEFTDACGDWLRKACTTATDPTTKCKIYYAIIATPMRYDGPHKNYPYYADNLEGRTYTKFAIDATWQTPKRYYWDYKTSLGTEAMDYLASHRDIVESDDVMRSCDMLSDYAAGKFIANPYK